MPATLKFIVNQSWFSMQRSTQI